MCNGRKRGLIQCCLIALFLLLSRAGPLYAQSLQTVFDGASSSMQSALHQIYLLFTGFTALLEGSKSPSGLQSSMVPDLVGCSRMCARPLHTPKRVPSVQECVYTSLLDLARRWGLDEFAGTVRCLRLACSGLDLPGAIMEGLEEEVHLLLVAGADPGKPDEPWRWSPLRLACVYNQPGIVKLLSLAGADMHERTEEGSVLHLAVEHGCSEVVGVLVQDLGADVYELSAMGRPPLQTACARCDAPMVKRLLECKADVNRPGPTGERPLDALIAVGWQQAPAVQLATLELLLQAGVQCTQPPREYMTCLPEQAASTLGMRSVAERIQTRREQQEKQEAAERWGESAFVSAGSGGAILQCGAGMGVVNTNRLF